MDTKQIQESIVKMIAEIIISTEDVVRQSSSLDELGMDSVLFIETVLHIEEKFDIQFDEEMLVYFKFPDVQSLVDYTVNLLEQ